MRKATVPYQGRRIPPLYAVAFIDPGIPKQQGQEAAVARYPLALVPQDNRRHFRKWRDDVKALNPDIVLLAYQMTILETTSPGPGHDVLRGVRNAWRTWPWGGQIRVEAKRRRVFDPRSSEWKAAFLNACAATLESYPYDGLFLDQCSVFSVHHPLKSVRNEMLQHLRETLLELRKRHPNKIFVGNSIYSLPGLNGIMSEDREEHFDEDLIPFDGQWSPPINLGLVLSANRLDDKVLKRKLHRVCSLGAFFTATQSYQHVTWSPIYDEVLKIAHGA
ncbi:MAG: hypothetical protein JXQ99_02700 [Hyphomicrobiaceae bacterium]